MKYSIWTDWNIEICIDGSSDAALSELEKEIIDFIEWLSAFEYFEQNIDKINWNISYRLRSINNK